MTKYTRNIDKDAFAFLDNPASEAAPRLLGCILERTIGGKTLRAKIVETEAYDQADAASHSFKWKTPRTEVMFGPAGHLYVYFTYGMHYCCNIVTGPAGHGAAVLIRAVEPLEGRDTMMFNRGSQSAYQLTNGPAKFCQAFGIDKSLNGQDLRREPLRLIEQGKLPANDIVTTTRIGISKAQDVPWRFYIRANPYVSKL
jgi:DNA-3-methyladenine glycosylase